LKENKKFAKNQIEFYVKSDSGVVACLWQDRKLVRLLTSGFSTGVDFREIMRYETTTTQIKPSCVQGYVENMRGIDVGNQLRSYYCYPHRSRKWWKKIFIEMLEITTINAYICFKALAKGAYYDQYDFRRNLLKLIFKEEIEKVENEKKKGKAIRHYPEFYEEDKQAKVQRARIKCKECLKLTQFICGKCSGKCKANIGLCVPDCFKLYHERFYKEN